MLVSFMLSFFPRDVLDGILNLIGSVSEGFPSYSCLGVSHWEEKFWKVFKNQYETSVRKFVPSSTPKPGFKPKPSWMTPDVSKDIKLKRRAWNRYLSTKRNIDFTMRKA